MTVDRRWLVFACSLWLGASACGRGERGRTDTARGGGGGGAGGGGPASGRTPALADSLENGDVRVTDAAITPLDSTTALGSALIEVRFAPAPRPERRITIHPEDRDIVLHDDGADGDRAAGDGVFSAITTVDFRQFAAEQARFARSPGNHVSVPRFEGRVRAAARRVEPVMLTNPREWARKRIPLFPLAFIDPNLTPRSLMITDPAVVGDPTRTFDICSGTGNATGKWTFGHLMTEMANQAATGIAPSDFARSWLAQWETPQTANGFTIPARTGIKSVIIDPWEAASGGPGSALDLTKAPFRLLAIVNRVDLRQNLVYGGGSAGEARFVFGAVDRRNGGCTPLRFTVIFEYGVGKKSCPDLKAWAKQWYDLKALAPSDPAYRTALEAITDQFSSAGANPAQTPNKNALNQLRTNELALGGPEWELREFKLDPTGAATGKLTSVTVKQEPDRSFNNGSVLADYVNTNATAIVQDRHQVPDQFPAGTPFLGARAPVPTPAFFWGRGADMTTPNSRFHFSLNTCSGCHGGETGTSFTHVSPTSGVPAALSTFLTGTPAPGITDPDPSDADNSQRSFGDLDRRSIDLDGLVNSPCLKQIPHIPINRMVH